MGTTTNLLTQFTQTSTTITQHDEQLPTNNAPKYPQKQLIHKIKQTTAHKNNMQTTIIPITQHLKQL